MIIPRLCFTDDKFNKTEFDKKVIKNSQVVTKGESWTYFYFGDKYQNTKLFVDSEIGKKFCKKGSYGIGFQDSWSDYRG